MEFKKIVVAGGGVLGSQIAFQSAYQGFDVTIWLRSEGSIARCKPKIDGLLATYQGILENMRTDESIRCPGISRAQHLTDAQIDELKDRALKAHGSIKLIASYEEAFSDADLVIEAVAEDPKQKEAFYGELAKHLPAKTVLVTNSSTLLPSKLAPFTDRPEKYLALHFANEIWIHNTAEVMGHPGTDPAVYQEVVEFAKAIGMVPLQLHKEQPGYLLNS
ncbi:MAG: 3-hydroxyacyl-CoA dehydrogenase NAD-binding domain-containing protein, partial [Coriobacteriales bacterium]|nr:3-hydroxyacyl-CoA dehydrogenase NAD-binding domain-containing protein [Coriobacteriales bacterium]